MVSWSEMARRVTGVGSRPASSCFSIKQTHSDAHEDAHQATGPPANCFSACYGQSRESDTVNYSEPSDDPGEVALASPRGRMTDGYTRSSVHHEGLSREGPAGGRAETDVGREARRRLREPGPPRIRARRALRPGVVQAVFTDGTRSGTPFFKISHQMPKCYCNVRVVTINKFYLCRKTENRLSQYLHLWEQLLSFP